jgi:phosphatidylserine decarboxylase
LDNPANVAPARPVAQPLVQAAALIHIAPEGAAMVLATAGAGILFLLFGGHSIGVVLLAVAIAFAAFFRDPERTAPARDDVVLSAADGKVTDIVESGCASLEGAFRRVSVFMSPLNVHVNRASIGGQIADLKHTLGEFRAAFRDYASEHNERNLIVLQDAVGRRHAIVQVAGYLARRIVCRLHPNDTVEAGQRIGLIMFGSRVDHFLPLQYRVTVNVGEKVRAGESVIGEFSR